MWVVLKIAYRSKIYRQEVYDEERRFEKLFSPITIRGVEIKIESFFFPTLRSMQVQIICPPKEMFTIIENGQKVAQDSLLYQAWLFIQVVPTLIQSMRLTQM